MECPSCGKTENKVIDSRLSKDGIAIRRRRQCLICSNRFTTYESDLDQLLPFLIRKKIENVPTIKGLRAMLSFMSTGLKLLSVETNNLTNKVEELEKAQANKDAQKKAREKKFAKRRAKSLMMNETVFKIIKRNKKGVDISKLKERTGFSNKKIHNIVFKLKKKGEIKSGGRGIYIKA